MLVAGDDFSVRYKISMRKTKIEKTEKELTQLRNYAASQMSNPNASFTSSQDQHSKSQLKISGLEQELQSVIDEVKDIEAQILSSGKRLVSVGITLFPKTVFSLGEEVLTVTKETAGPIKAEIVAGEIQLNKGERSSDI
jgi:hypothetical protein